MSDGDPSTEPLLCSVNGDGCHMIVFSPLSLKGESVSFCAPAHSIHLQSSYLGQSVPFLPGADPRTLLSPSPPTSVSTPVPPASHVLVKKAESDFLCRSSSCHRATHQSFRYMYREAWSVSLWTSLTAAAFAPFVLPLMCIWLENCSGRAWLHIFVALVS